MPKYCEIGPIPVSPAEPYKDVRVRSIALVGAFKEANDVLVQEDILKLGRVFRICAQNGIQIDPRVELSVVNLTYGDDFLKNPPTADMVVFSYIFYYPPTINKNFEPFFKQSPDAELEDLWHKSLVASKAKIAFNIFLGRGESELPTNFIDHPPFSVVSISPDTPFDMNFALLACQP